MKKLFIFVLVFLLAGCDGEITINLGDPAKDTTGELVPDSSTEQIDDEDNKFEDTENNPVDTNTADPDNANQTDSNGFYHQTYGAAGEVVRAKYVDLLIKELTYEADTVLIPMEGRIYSVLLGVKNIDTTLTYIDSYDYELISSDGSISNPSYSGEIETLNYASLIPGGYTEGYLHFDIPTNFKPETLRKYDYYSGEMVAEISLTSMLSPTEQLKPTVTLEAKYAVGSIMNIEDRLELMITSVNETNTYGGYYAQLGYKFIVVDGMVKSLEAEDTVMVSTFVWELISYTGRAYNNYYYGTNEEIDATFLMPGGILTTRSVYMVPETEDCVLYFNDAFEITTPAPERMFDLYQTSESTQELRHTYQMESGIGGLRTWQQYEDISFRVMSHQLEDSAIYYYLLEEPYTYIKIELEVRNDISIDNYRLLNGAFMLVDQNGVTVFELYNYEENTLVYESMDSEETMSGSLLFQVNKESTYHLLFYDYDGWFSAELDLGVIGEGFPDPVPDTEPMVEDTTDDTDTEQVAENGLVRITHALTPNEDDSYEYRIGSIMTTNAYQIQIEDLYFTDGKDFTVAANGKDYAVVKLNIKNISSESVWPSVYLFGLNADGTKQFNVGLSSTFSGSYDELVPGGCVTWEIAYLIDESVRNLLYEVNPNVDYSFVVDLTTKDTASVPLVPTDLHALAPYERGDVLTLGMFEVQVTELEVADSKLYSTAADGKDLYIYTMLVHNLNTTTSANFSFTDLKIIGPDGIRTSLEELDQTANSMYTVLMPNGYFKFEFISEQKEGLTELILEVDLPLSDPTRIALMREKESYTALINTYQSLATKGMNESILWFDLDIKVNSIAETLGFDDGYHKVTLNFTIENKATEGTVTFRREYLNLVDETGRAYTSMMNYSDADLAAATLNPGEKRTGELTFLVSAPNGVGSQIYSLAYFASNFATYDDVLDLE